MRLDAALVARGLVGTRARARDLVRRGLVRVDGITAGKPAHPTTSSNVVSVEDDAARHVSRGAEKLIGALDAFGFAADGMCCLDVGASTGGFTEVLLDRGARRVYAVDVGHGQLHPKLRVDPRVVQMERCDARSLTPELIPDRIDAVCIDVSFISLSKVLPGVMELARVGGWLIALIKPQFEVGPEHVGKGGIVRDSAQRARAVETVSAAITSARWTVVGTVASSILGGDGNQEFLIGAVKT